MAGAWSPAAPLIWCGDLNVAPQPIDVHDPKRLLGHVCFTPEVWEAYASVRSWGLVDLFRKHHPDEAGRYTFFDYRVPGGGQAGPRLADRSHPRHGAAGREIDPLRHRHESASG
jgi:exonuclease III